MAALPMYDWPETRAEVDAEWAQIGERLRAAGHPAPINLVRSNAEMPPVPGGIRNAAGAIVAPDPATLPPDDLDMPTLWRHPDLLFGQTCWGPMELGLSADVRVVGQPDYSAFEGGDGDLYSSAIVMRRSASNNADVPGRSHASLPLEAMRGTRLAYNSDDSMSGLIALMRDLERAGEGRALFADTFRTGAHRASIRAVAAGEADVAAIDCRTWALARRFEPAAEAVRVVGWTALRPGLPYITAKGSPLKSRIAF